VALFIKAALDAAAHVVQDGLVNFTQLLSPLCAALDVAVLSAAAAKDDSACMGMLGSHAGTVP
jgi:hypothetical protein